MTAIPATAAHGMTMHTTAAALLNDAVWVREKPSHYRGYKRKGHLYTPGSVHSLCRRSDRPSAGRIYGRDGVSHGVNGEEAFLFSRCELCARILETATVATCPQHTDVTFGADPVELDTFATVQNSWVGAVITRVHGTGPDGVQHFDIDESRSTSWEQFSRLVRHFGHTATHAQFHTASNPYTPRDA